MHRTGASVFCVPRKVISEFEVRSVLRTGRIFDTPSLKGSLQSASSALGLLLDLKRLENCRALCGAFGLPRKEILCW